jgi:hypothetical protein
MKYLNNKISCHFYTLLPIFCIFLFLTNKSSELSLNYGLQSYDTEVLQVVISYQTMQCYIQKTRK